MGFLYWRPTDAERLAILTAIFSGLLHPDEVARLMKAYEHRSVSFFAQVRGAVVRDVCSTLVSNAEDSLAAVASAPDKYRSFVTASMLSIGADAIGRVEAQARVMNEAFESAEGTYLR
jgi:hypothetical protein